MTHTKKKKKYFLIVQAEPRPGQHSFFLTLDSSHFLYICITYLQGTMMQRTGPQYNEQSIITFSVGAVRTQIKTYIQFPKHPGKTYTFMCCKTCVSRSKKRNIHLFIFFYINYILILKKNSAACTYQGMYVVPSVYNYIYLL